MTENARKYTLTSYGLICYKKTENNNKIILIRRKNTIGYVEFLRGKYDCNNVEYLLQLFNYMTIAEKEDIVKYNDFIKLRELLGMTKSHNIYRNEYEKAHKKFNILKEHPTFNFEYLIKNSNIFLMNLIYTMFKKEYQTQKKLLTILDLRQQQI